MFGWMDIGPMWVVEDCRRVLYILKHNRIPCWMSVDETFFANPFVIPQPDRLWSIRVLKRHRNRALALLAQEGLVRSNAVPPECGRVARARPDGATEAAAPAFSRRILPGTTQSG